MFVTELEAEAVELPDQLGPDPDPELERSRRRIVLKGELPSPLRPPSGCVFRTRCPRATEICADVVPAVETVTREHDVVCHHWRET